MTVGIWGGLREEVTRPKKKTEGGWGKVGEMGRY